MKSFKQFLTEKTAGTIACPNCGKLVAANTENCPFCDTNLLTAIRAAMKKKADDDDLMNRMPWDKVATPVRKT